MYVLDTNTLIYYFKGLGKVADQLMQKSPQEIGIPSIVMFEVAVGIAKSKTPGKRLAQLDEIAAVVNILDFTTTEAKSAAIIRAELEERGTPIGPYDLLIAGTALANQSVLVTRNTKEFGRIEKLQLEDWY